MAERVLHLLEQSRWPLSLRDICGALQLPQQKGADLLAAMQAGHRLVQDKQGYWRISAAEVAQQVAAFLATRVAADTGGWPLVTEADVQTLARLFALIVDAKWERDVDGDSAIAVQICDRTRQDFVHFRYPPHYGEDIAGADFRQAMSVCQHNLELAFERIEALWRWERWQQAAATPAQGRQEDA